MQISSLIERTTLHTPNSPKHTKLPWTPIPLKRRSERRSSPEKPGCCVARRPPSRLPGIAPPPAAGAHGLSVVVVYLAAAAKPRPRTVWPGCCGSPWLRHLARIAHSPGTKRTSAFPPVKIRWMEPTLVVKHPPSHLLHTLALLCYSFSIFYYIFPM